MIPSTEIQTHDSHAYVCAKART